MGQWVTFVAPRPVPAKVQLPQSHQLQLHPLCSTGIITTDSSLAVAQHHSALLVPPIRVPPRSHLPSRSLAVRLRRTHHGETQ